MYKPEAGDLLLFPSSYAYAHYANPVTDNGTKYTLALMTDKNTFMNRKDSPIRYDPNFLLKHGFYIEGINGDK